MGIMNETVQEGVGVSWVSNDVVPGWEGAGEWAGLWASWYRYYLRPLERNDRMTGYEVISGSETASDARKHWGLHRLDLSQMRRRSALPAFGIMAFLLLPSILVSSRVIAEAPTLSAPVKSVVFLGVKFQNDHAAQEPTTDAERARLASIEELFKSKLEASGQYTFTPMPVETKAKIAAAPSMGECGGCEIDYGKQLGGDLVAWIVVQKVSNLILNINVYIADVATQKMTFVQSADIRGNTDQSWTRGITYIVKNHVIRKPM